MKFKSKICKVCLLVLFSGTASADVSTMVQRAKDAFLRGDGNSFLSEAKSALEESDDPAIKQEVTDLYATAAQNGLLNRPGRGIFLPKGISYASFEVQRRYVAERGKAFYFGALYLSLPVGVELEKLSLEQIPQLGQKSHPANLKDSIIIEKGTKKGIWRISQNADDHTTEVWVCNTPSVKAPVESVYILTVKMKNQPEEKMKFYGSAGLNSPASPKVLSPAVKHVFEDGKPLFKWENIPASVSPLSGRKPWIDVRVKRADKTKSEVFHAHIRDSEVSETTSLQMGAYALSKDSYETKSDKLAWRLSEIQDQDASELKWYESDFEKLQLEMKNPEPARGTVSGLQNLRSGKYIFSVSYREFIGEYGGGMDIIRTSSTEVPFTVK